MNENKQTNPPETSIKQQALMHEISQKLNSFSPQEKAVVSALIQARLSPERLTDDEAKRKRVLAHVARVYGTSVADIETVLNAQYSTIDSLMDFYIKDFLKSLGTDVLSEADESTEVSPIDITSSSDFVNQVNNDAAFFAKLETEQENKHTAKRALVSFKKKQKELEELQSSLPPDAKVSMSDIKTALTALAD